MGITIWGWVLIVAGVVVAVGAIVLAVTMCGSKKTQIGIILAGIVIAILLIGGVLVYSNTESGKRAYRDQQSNFSGGIERIVTVRDINGKVIEKYEGKFDVEINSPGYVVFDDENGKRHILLSTTGTIMIDDK